MTRSINSLRTFFQYYSYRSVKIKQFLQNYQLFLRIGGTCVFVASVAACASQSSQPSIPIAQEVAQYKAHARSYYAPPGPPDDPWGPYIEESSRRFDVPEEWIRAVMNQESGGKLYHNGELVTSGPGAMGLMQLMPPTYDEMRVAYNLGGDAYDPHDNIMAGTAYIRQMYDIYGSPGFLAAYNGGPGRLDDFLVRNRSLPLETRRYVASIGRQIRGISPIRRSQADLMVASYETNGSVNYASIQPTFQAQTIQQVWKGRLQTEQLNNNSLSGTAQLNAPRLKSAGQPVQVAMAQEPISNTTTGSYPVRWKSFGKATDSQEVESVWASRGYASTSNTYHKESVNSLPAAVLTSEKPVLRPMTYQLKTTRKPETLVKNTQFVIPNMARGDWSIQVGAFNSSNQAHSAAGKAKLKAGLGGVQQVEMVRAGKNKLYRARVAGLSRSAAASACKRLGQNACLLVPPGVKRS